MSNSKEQHKPVKPWPEWELVSNFATGNRVAETALFPRPVATERTVASFEVLRAGLSPRDSLQTSWQVD